MKSLLVLLLVAASSLLTAQSTPSEMPSAERAVGVFSGNEDVGGASSGTAAYDAETGEYVITGSGSNMWSTHDEFHFLWRRLSGDFILRADAAFLGEGVDPHRKMGWIVRSSLDPDATYIDAAVHGDGLTALQFRRSVGGETEEIRSTVISPDVIQLSRTEKSFSMAVARAGETFTRAPFFDLDLGDEVYVGLFVCSHNAEIAERAVFRNVRIVVPAPPELLQYQEYLASNLEVLDVQTGRRSVVHRTPDSMQAPNWTPEGRELIYNRNGLLYRFDLETRTATELDTGFATNNNNDHVLSFDGTMLGISHHDPDSDNQSIIYTLPAAGGTPRRVTPLGPSYLHGWSPDKKFLIYTGGRDGDYDIFRIPVDGGEEVRLTPSTGLDDGSEYSPDGRWIYFNSVRSGTMQLWRMKPDGSESEQLTNDAFNNWFPHISPDGESIAFLSYGSDVEPGDHPFYKEVYLRLMPADGGKPRVIAYLYGGQGTINVPSWAPDSRRLAFVSNSAAN